MDDLEQKKAEYHEPTYKLGQCGQCGITKAMDKGDYLCYDCRGLKDPVQARLEAAENVCWTLLMMMALGGLEIDQEWRDYLIKSYEPWADLAVLTGIMKAEEGEEKSSVVDQKLEIDNSDAT